MPTSRRRSQKKKRKHTKRPTRSLSPRLEAKTSDVKVSLGGPDLTQKKIVKFCGLKYHISTTETVRVGTLNFYKAYDNDFIKDPTEGEYESEVGHSVRTEYSTKSLNKAPTDVTFAGPGKLVMLPGAKIVIKHQVENVYVFCASLMDRNPAPDLERSTEVGLDGYDSSYEISRPLEFAEAIRAALQMKLGRAVIGIQGTVTYEDERRETYYTLRDLTSAVTSTTLSGSHFDVFELQHPLEIVRLGHEEMGGQDFLDDGAHTR
jgi:hypothetical protein